MAKSIFSVLSETKRYLLTIGGELLFTNDGGESFSVSPINKLSKKRKLLAVNLNFYDEMHGEMAVSLLDDKHPYIFNTNIGGNIWKMNIIKNTTTEKVGDVF